MSKSFNVNNLMHINEIIAPQQYTRDQLERMSIDDLDRMAFGHVQGEILDLPPNQINIKYKDDLENPIHKYKTLGMAWIRSVDFTEPVEISIAQNGKFYLEDGHHRWFASRILKRLVKAIISKIDGKPIEVILGKIKPPYSAGVSF